MQILDRLENSAKNTVIPSQAASVPFCRSWSFLTIEDTAGAVGAAQVSALRRAGPCWHGRLQADPDENCQKARRGFRRAFLNASVFAGTDSFSRNVESDLGCVNNCQRFLLAAFWLRPQQSFPSHVGSSNALRDGHPHTAPQAGFERSSKRPSGRS